MQRRPQKQIFNSLDLYEIINATLIPPDNIRLETVLFIIFSLRIKHFKVLFFKGYNHFTGFLRAKLILIPNIRKFANRLFLIGNHIPFYLRIR